MLNVEVLVAIVRLSLLLRPSNQILRGIAEDANLTELL